MKAKQRFRFHSLKLISAFVLISLCETSFAAFQPVASVSSTIPGSPFVGDGFGLTVETNKDYLFVGSPFARPLDANNVVAGAVYVYKKNNNGSYTNTQIIKTNGGSDHIGANQIRAIGDWLFFSAVGTPIGPLSPTDTVNNQNFKGSVQIYKFDKKSGLYNFYQALDEQTPGLSNLTTADPGTFDSQSNPLWFTLEQGASFGLYFGLDKSDMGLLVGAEYQINNGPDNTQLLNSGVVYSFKFSELTKKWILTQVIKNPEGPKAFDMFGSHIAVDDGLALIANAPFFQFPKFGPYANNSSVYVFNKVLGIWVPTQKVKGDQSTLPLGNTFIGTQLALGDAFGAGLALDGNKALIGAPLESQSPTIATYSGAVYVYKVVTGPVGILKGLIRTQKIVSDDTSSIMTGFHVEYDSKTKTALISDPGRIGPTGNAYQGGLIVMKEDNAGQLQPSEVIFQPNGTAQNFFGTGLKLDGNVIVGGGGPIVGAAFPNLGLFVLPTNRPPLIPSIPFPAVPVTVFKN